MNFIERFKSLPISSRRLLSIGMIFALVVALPLFIWAIVTQKFLFSQRAASGEPAHGTPINWIYGSISITADNFYIISNGRIYDGNSNIAVNAGPSGPNAQGIEIASNIYGDNLKLQMMFRKDTNNYTWWVDQITFVNSSYSPDTNSYNGIFFKSVLGQSFQDPGRISMIVRNPNNGLQIAEVHYTNLRIQGFSGQTPPPTACQPYPMTLGIDGVSGTTGINQAHRYYVRVTHNDPNCLGRVTVNLSARLPDGWRVLFEKPSFTLNSNTTYYTTVDIIPTTYNSLNEPIIFYANTIYPLNTASKTVELFVQSTNTPVSTPSTNECGKTCASNYDCISSSSCVNGYCRNPLCRVSTPPPQPLTCTQLQNSQSQFFSQCFNAKFTDVCFNKNTGVYQGCANNDGCVSNNVNATSNVMCSTGYVSPTPPPTVRPFSIRFKFEGVNDESANLAKVVVRFVSRALDNTLGYITSPVPADYEGNGIYALHFGIWSTGLPAANDYSLILKGEKHLGIKFCSANGQTTHCSSNQTGTISLPVNPIDMVSLNFTGVPLVPGDLYNQDGVANANDFAKISSLMTKPCSALTDTDKLTADLDYNGCVNIRDAFLMRQTLETRFDEN